MMGLIFFGLTFILVVGLLWWGHLQDEKIKAKEKKLMGKSEK